MPVPAVLLGLFLSACVSAGALDPDPVAGRGFQVGRDSLAFRNLVRSQRPDLDDPFANYCIPMTRATTQFFRFARFSPEQARVPAAEYARLVREILARPPWAPPRADRERVVIPGYADLFAFSRDQEQVVKQALGSSLLSMIHWRTWRIALALSPEHQEGVARELRQEVDGGRPAPVMITNFPHEDLLNHAVLVYDYRQRSGVVEFLAYDPNDPGSPLSLHFDPASRAFWVEPLSYSPPGRIRAFRLYASPLL